MNRLGALLLAGGLAGLGTLSLIYQDFALNWQPVPASLPHRSLFAVISGGLLVLAALGTLTQRFRRAGSITLAVSVTLWLVLLQVPRVATREANAGTWLGFAETMMLVSGLWILVGSSAGPGSRVGRRAATRTLQVLYALSLPVVGLSHFVYADFTATFVPGWLPFHLGFAYLTGAGHVAAGVGMLLGLLPVLAATLEACMIGTFVLLLHLPAVVSAPSDRVKWTMLAFAVSMTGAATLVAAATKHLSGRRQE